MNKVSSSGRDPLPAYKGVVHVGVPAAVTFDLEKMRKVLPTVLAHLGCDNCHSGWDIRYRMITDFVVNEKLQLTPVAITGMDERLAFEGGVVGIQR